MNFRSEKQKNNPTPKMGVGLSSCSHEEREKIT
jgi:hypothetical protein